MRSRFASQYASMVPTSRQYGGSPGLVPTQLRPNGCATAWPLRTARGMMSLPKSWLEAGSAMSRASSAYSHCASNT